MSEADRLLVIVEDDAAFARTLRRSFERRDYQVLVAASHDELVALLADHWPGYAVVDLKLGGASGLACVQTLRAVDAEMKIVVLTCDGSDFVSIITSAASLRLTEPVMSQPTGKGS